MSKLISVTICSYCDQLIDVFIDSIFVGLSGCIWFSLPKNGSFKSSAVLMGLDVNHFQRTILSVWQLTHAHEFIFFLIIINDGVVQERMRTYLDNRERRRSQRIVAYRRLLALSASVAGWGWTRRVCDWRVWRPRPLNGCWRASESVKVVPEVGSCGGQSWWCRRWCIGHHVYRRRAQMLYQQDVSTWLRFWQWLQIGFEERNPLDRWEVDWCSGWYEFQSSPYRISTDGENINLLHVIGGLMTREQNSAILFNVPINLRIARSSHGCCGILNEHMDSH